MSNEHERAFLAGMAALRIDAAYTDMTIICDGKKFKVHRAVVCPQSEVLANEVNSTFQESNGVINHEEYDHNTVDRMIQFMYTQDYQVPAIESVGVPEVPNLKAEAVNSAKQAGWKPDEGVMGVEAPVDSPETISLQDHLMAHVRVHGLGSYYNVPQLKIKARDKFQKALKLTSWNLNDLIDILDLIYEEPESQDVGLRASIVELAVDHVNEFITTKALADKAEEHAFVGDFCVKLLAKVAERTQVDQQKYVMERNEAKKKFDKALERKVQEQRFLEEKALAQMQDFNEIVRSVNEFQNCARCGPDLGARVEVDATSRSGQVGYAVVCRKCGRAP